MPRHLRAGWRLLRLLVQWAGVNFHNPICQGLYRFTNPVLMPLRRWIKAWRRIDLAAALATLGILWVKAALVRKSGDDSEGGY